MVQKVSVLIIEPIGVIVDFEALEVEGSSSNSFKFLLFILIFNNILRKFALNNTLNYRSNFKTKFIVKYHSFFFLFLTI